MVNNQSGMAAMQMPPSLRIINSYEFRWSE